MFDDRGDAWKYDEQTDSYYLHYFAQKQPDLNWSNPKVREEVMDIMKYWAEKGVDGFRLDAFQFAAKDTTFPVFPEGFEKDFFQYYAVQDGLHDYLREMYDKVFSQYNVMSVAEGAGKNFQDAHDLVDENRKELNMAYAFDGVEIAKYEGYELSELKRVFSEWDAQFAENGWLSIFLANHDQARMVSRFGNDSEEFRSPSSKLLNTFVLSMKGTPYCYYGDELGMTKYRFSEYRPIQRYLGNKWVQKAQHNGEDMEYFMKKLNFESRDNGRTPMQWDETKEAGFTSGTPWLPVNENHTFINVQKQEKDSNSVLSHFKKMTALRLENPVLIYGAYTLIQGEHPTVYAYTRELDGQKVLVVLNFSEKKATFSIAEFSGVKQSWINNYDSLDMQEDQLNLLPYQAVILELN